MPTVFEYGGPIVDLLDMKVAANNLDGTFGTAVDVPGAQMASIKMTATSVQAEGDGEIVATYTRTRGAELRMRNVSVSSAVYGVLFGTNNYEYGESVSHRRIMRHGPQDMPYFALAWKSASADAGSGTSGGCAVVFVPRCKVTEAPNLQFAYNTFVLSEVGIQALPEPYYLNEYGDPSVYEIILYQSDVSVTIPPLSYM